MNQNIPNIPNPVSNFENVYFINQMSHHSVITLSSEIEREDRRSISDFCIELEMDCRSLFGDMNDKHIIANERER